MSKNAYLSIVLLITGSCICFACSSPKKAAGHSSELTSSCAAAWNRFADQPRLVFNETKLATASLPTTTILPSEYKAYKVTAESLQQFFAFVKDRNPSLTHAGIVLPLNDVCNSFEIYPSGTLSPGLQSRYPDMVSLKGNGLENGAADLRLNWDGQQMSGQIIENGGKVWLIMPVKTGNEIVYLFYDKANTGEVKLQVDAPVMIRQNLTR